MNCIPFKFSIEGQEFEAFIPEESFSAVQKLITKDNKKTGYERSELGRWYWYDDGDGNLERDPENAHAVDDTCYRAANYYSSEEVARNNARADKLMRQLRRFAVEHRKSNIDWNDIGYKYVIRFGHGNNMSLFVDHEVLGHDFGIVAFDSENSAQLAIETFHDELMWYFTEYKDSL